MQKTAPSVGGAVFLCVRSDYDLEEQPNKSGLADLVIGDFGHHIVIHICSPFNDFQWA